LIKWIGGIINGVIANAVYDRIKLFAKDKPDEYGKNDIEAFKAYLQASNHNEITLRLDDILSLSQQNKDIGAGNALTLKEILEATRAMSSSSKEMVEALRGGFAEIAKSLKPCEEKQEPEVLLGIKLCNAMFVDAEKPFSSAVFRIAPYVENLKGQQIEPALFEVKMPPTALNCRVIQQQNVKPVFSHAENSLQFDMTSLFGGKTFSPVSLEFTIHKNNFEALLEATMKIAFRWKDGFVDKSFILRDIFKCNDEVLVTEDFREPKPKKKRQQPEPSIYWI